MMFRVHVMLATLLALFPNISAAHDSFGIGLMANRGTIFLPRRNSILNNVIDLAETANSASSPRPARVPATACSTTLSPTPPIKTI